MVENQQHELKVFNKENKIMKDENTEALKDLNPNEVLTLIKSNRT